MGVSLSAGSSNGPSVFDPHVNGGAVGARALALTDGTEVATAGICRAVDLSSIPATISANGNTADIDVAAFSYLFWYGQVSSVAGGSSPKIDFYLDYTDGAGNVMGSGIQKLVQFNGAGSNGVNVGPVAGGAVGGGSGYVITPTIQIRWVLTGGGTWSGALHKMFGR